MKKALSLFAMASVLAHATKPHFALDYADVAEHDPANINAGGTELDIYFAPRRDFLVLQNVGAAATIDELGVVDTAHTFTAPAGFRKLRVEVDQNSVKHELMGSGGGTKNSARVFIKGNQDTVRGIAQQLNNDDCIFIIPLKDGKRPQIGSKTCVARVTASFDSTTDSSTDPRGWALDIVCYDKYATYYGDALAITLAS